MEADPAFILLWVTITPLQPTCDRIILQLNIMHLMIKLIVPHPNKKRLHFRDRVCSVDILKDTEVCGDSLKSVNILNVHVTPEEAVTNSKHQ